MTRVAESLAQGSSVTTTLESIYREHRQGLFTLALSITRRRDRAEDAVHDAFARMLRAEQSRSSPQGDRVAYAFASVRNAAIDIVRKKSELAIEAIAGESSDGESIYARLGPSGQSNRDGASDEPLLAAETQSLVQQAIRELPDATRQVLVMKLHGGLTFEQISQAMNEPLPTVASRYRRALDRLKERLQPVAAE